MAEAHSIMHFSEQTGSDKTLSGEGYRKVAQYLSEQGVEPVVVRGNSEYDLAAGTVVPRKILIEEHGDETLVHTESADDSISIGETSIRAYSGALTSQVETTGAQVINNYKVRELDRKDAAYRLIEEHQPRTLTLAPDHLVGQLADIRTDLVVLKPVQASNSIGRLIVPKAELTQPDKFEVIHKPDGAHLVGHTDTTVDLHLERQRGYLMQEFINSHVPFPDSVHLLESCRAMYEQNIHARKELRLMVYWDTHRADQQLVIPYARIFPTKATAASETVTSASETDQWLLVDIDKGLPSDLAPLVDSTIHKILDYGKTPYLHGAVDVAFDGHRWYIVELNLWFPTPPSYKLARQHGAESLADVHRHGMADLLAHAAQDAKKAKDQP